MGELLSISSFRRVSCAT